MSASLFDAAATAAYREADPRWRPVGDLMAASAHSWPIVWDTLTNDDDPGAPDPDPHGTIERIFGRQLAIARALTGEEAPERG